MQVTDQEIRNAVYRGDFNNLIRDLAKSKRWLIALNKTSLDKRMRDEELILRFFAVHEKFKQYQPPIKTFLNEYMREKTFKKVGAKRIRINLTDQEKGNLTKLFNQTMDKVAIVFEDHAFRAYIGDKWEKQINRPLFDAVTLVFSELKIDDLSKKKTEIETELKKLFENPEFSEATSGSKAHRNRFVTRVKSFSLALASIGLDSKIHEGFTEE
jgi:hypothetical protein